MLKSLVLGGAVILVGVMAGFIFSYSNSVMPGLANLPDPDFVRAMQELNRSTLNGWFFLSFMGAPLFLAAASVLHLFGTRPVVTVLIVVAAVVYIVGVFGVTVVVNVPLNNALDLVNPNAAAAELSQARDAFEGNWNSSNDIRTMSAIASLGLLVVAFLMRDGK